MIYEADSAECFDLKRSFQQYPLAERVRKYFSIAVNVEGEVKVLRLTRTSTGFTKSPAIGDYTCKLLAYLAAPTYQPETVIDNVRFFHGEGRKFVELARAVNAVLNDNDERAPHQVGKFCGPLYDYKNKTVCLQQKTLQKLILARDTVDSWTIEDMSHHFGTIFYASTVLQAPIATYYAAMKFYRRRYSAVALGTLGPQSPAAIWPSARPQLLEWLDYLVSNKPVHPRVSCFDPKWVIFTDATPKGWAAIIVNQDAAQVSVFTGQFTPDDARSINEKELEAAVHALRKLKEICPAPNAVHIWIDNTSAAAALRRRRSGKFTLNKLAAIAEKELANVTAFSVAYIRSEDNPPYASSFPHARDHLTQTRSRVAT